MTNYSNLTNEQLYITYQEAKTNFINAIEGTQEEIEADRIFTELSKEVENRNLDLKSCKIISILEKYDRETKGTLALDFKHEVLNNKNLKAKEFIEILINEWTPIWLEDREEDKEIIEWLVYELNKIY